VLTKESQYKLDYSLEGIWKLANSDLCVDFNLELIDKTDRDIDLFTITIETGVQTIQPDYGVFEVRFKYTVKITTNSEIVTNSIADRFVQNNTPCLSRRSWHKPTPDSYYNHGDTLEYYPKGRSY